MRYIKTGSTIGILGGGQLGKMLAQSAKKMGYRVIILDPTEDCSASQVSDDQIVADYDDEEALKELNRRCDVVTYEFENVDADRITKVFDSFTFPQGVKALIHTQERVEEKTMIQKEGLKCTKWRSVKSKEELDEAIKVIGYPAVLKTTRFGYDGKGQLVLKNKEALKEGYQLVEQANCILEAFVDFDFEASVMIARNEAGQKVLFPASRNEHWHNILHLSEVPARLNPKQEQQITNAALKLAEALDWIGSLGIEFFVKGDDIYVNELAPRPHNSGHYSIEACDFSQFDLHIKALTGQPLPQKIKLLSNAVMVNVLGQHLKGVEKLKQEKGSWSFHDYVKGEGRKNRKMGHITILTEDTQKTIQEIQQNWYMGGRLKMEEKLYEGKAKQLFKTDEKNLLRVHYLDQATALNGKKKDLISGKGALNNQISSLIFDYLKTKGVRTHFVKQLNETDQLVEAVKIIPLECIVRNYAAGHFTLRLGVEKGTEIKPEVVEFSYKNDALDDPLVNDDYIRFLKLCTSEQLEAIKTSMRDINHLLKDLFDRLDLTIVDFKLEYGLNADQELVLADEITPDTCRLWKKGTQESLDKDLYREDKGDIIPVYEEIYTRLKEKLNA